MTMTTSFGEFTYVKGAFGSLKNRCNTDYRGCRVVKSRTTKLPDKRLSLFSSSRGASSCGNYERVSG